MGLGLDCASAGFNINKVLNVQRFVFLTLGPGWYSTEIDPYMYMYV